MSASNDATENLKDTNEGNNCFWDFLESDQLLSWASQLMETLIQCVCVEPGIALSQITKQGLPGSTGKAGLRGLHLL